MPVSDPNVGQAMRRGLAGRCPNCGRGRMFSGYLSIMPNCLVCANPLGRYRAADGPAFFTMTVVGLLLIPVMGISYVRYRPDPLQLAGLVTFVFTVLTLVILRLSKGAIVGYLWATDSVDDGA
jgi:uncharacterized protein (DUF983 family)